MGTAPPKPLPKPQTNTSGEATGELSRATPGAAETRSSPRSEASLAAEASEVHRARGVLGAAAGRSGMAHVPHARRERDRDRERASVGDGSVPRSLLLLEGLQVAVVQHLGARDFRRPRSGCCRAPSPHPTPRPRSAWSYLTRRAALLRSFGAGQLECGVQASGSQRSGLRRGSPLAPGLEVRR